MTVRSTREFFNAQKEGRRSQGTRIENSTSSLLMTMRVSVRKATTVPSTPFRSPVATTTRETEPSSGTIITQRVADVKKPADDWQEIVATVLGLAAPQQGHTARGGNLLGQIGVTYLSFGLKGVASVYFGNL